MWKVDAAGVRTEVWKTKMPYIHIRPVSIRPREPKSKGDVPEKMYEIKGAAVG